MRPINLIDRKFREHVYRVSNCRQNIALVFDWERKPVFSPQLKHVKCSQIIFGGMCSLSIISMRPSCDQMGLRCGRMENFCYSRNLTKSVPWSIAFAGNIEVDFSKSRRRPI